MALELNGTTGVSLVQDGVITDANLPAGSVLQVVQGTASTQVESSFSTSTDLGLSVSITPSSASSKILVIVQCAGCGARDSATYWEITLRRDSTDLIDFASYIGNQTTSVSTYPNTGYLDSPNTTSAVSYNLRGLRIGGSANCVFNFTPASSTTSTIIAMEIAG